MKSPSPRRRSLPWFRRAIRAAILARMVYQGRQVRRRLRRAPRTALVADLAPALGTGNGVTVRGRLIRVERPESLHEVSPFDDVAADFLPHTQVDLLLLDGTGGTAAGPVTARTDRFGFFAARLSLEREVPARTRLHSRCLVRGRLLPGGARVLLLPREDRGPVLISDVDKTYLVSEIRSPRDIVRLLAGTGRARRPLDGMTALVRRLANGPLAMPVAFLTGTPFFFKRSLESRFELDGLEPASLRLRPPSPPIRDELSVGELARYLDALSHQYAFKLSALLEMAEDLPPACGVVLLGDDNQQDPHVYGTLAAWLDGALTAPEILDLATLNGAIPDEWESLY